MAELLIERVTTLAPDPASAAVARRFVRAALVDGDREEWAERAELAVSELVTNAILHAHTELVVTVAITGDAATVSVRDAAPQLPSQRHWGESATTGRGLALVALLSVSYGVDVAPGGKTVWFRLDHSLSEADETHDVAGDLGGVGQSATWDVDDWDIDGPAAGSEPEGHDTVVLLDLPVLLWLASQQHQEAVLRELLLMRADADGEVGRVDLTAAGRALAALGGAVERGLAAAATAGAPPARLAQGHPDNHSSPPSVPAAVDAVVVVPVDGHSDFAALQDVLDAGRRLGAADRMLLRPALPETVALRDWACEQVLAQLNGVPATPWVGAAHPRFIDPASAGETAPAPDWDDSVVRTTDRAAVAADDNNRIVAMSAAAADLLGWPAAELVGRRVVTIVPERLREAHVAGFTRHLTTGEAHVIGTEVTLPVLRRDGAEISCRFLIERAPAGRGRAVYVAWLTPAD
ncbi:MAG: hypothetical protein QOF57_2356 [Frankiaceae bacterium]|nr:hypothetical protein [Frankiaceae bacterium]